MRQAILPAGLARFLILLVFVSFSRFLSCRFEYLIYITHFSHPSSLSFSLLFSLLLFLAFLFSSSSFLPLLPFFLFCVFTHSIYLTFFIAVPLSISLFLFHGTANSKSISLSIHITTILYITICSPRAHIIFALHVSIFSITLCFLTDQSVGIISQSVSTCSSPVRAIGPPPR